MKTAIITTKSTIDLRSTNQIFKSLESIIKIHLTKNNDQKDILDSETNKTKPVIKLKIILDSNEKIPNSYSTGL